MLSQQLPAPRPAHPATLHGSCRPTAGWPSCKATGSSAGRSSGGKRRQDPHQGQQNQDGRSRPAIRSPIGQDGPPWDSTSSSKATRSPNGAAPSTQGSKPLAGQSPGLSSLSAAAGTAAGGAAGTAAAAAAAASGLRQLSLASGASAPRPTPRASLTSSAPAADCLSGMAWQAVLRLVQLCEGQGLDYGLCGWAAGLAQGLELPTPSTEGSNTQRPLVINVQWDGLPTLHQTACAAFASGQASVSPVLPIPMGSCFVVSVPVEWLWRSRGESDPRPAGVPGEEGSQSSHPAGSQPKADSAAGEQLLQVVVCCEQSIVVSADPCRTLVHVLPTRVLGDAGPVQPAVPLPASQRGQQSQPASTYVWVESLWSLRRNASHPSGALGALTAAAAAAVGQAQPLQPALVTQPAQPVQPPPATQPVQLPLASQPAQPAQPAQPRLAAQQLAPPDPLLVAAVTARLGQLQALAASANSSAWADGDTASAWVKRFGTPEVAAAWVTSDPAARLGGSLLRLLQSEGPLTGRRVTNLMGSHGLKALALACLTGETVTVVDVSPGNARYANQVADHAGLPLRYIVSDVLCLSEVVPYEPVSTDAHGQPHPDALWGFQDWVVMEQGILHYFTDLQALFSVVLRLLRPSGCLVLRDFHPISTKLLSSRGNKHKVDGNYFDSALAPAAAAFTKYQPSASGAAAGQGEADQQPATEVLLRRWTLGEVVTACATSGLVLVSLDEEPGPKAADVGIPKGFTLVARRPWPGGESGP